MIGNRVNQEKGLKTLASLGLTELEAKAYLLLVKNGPTKASGVTKALEVSKQRVYPVIKNLQRKGIVNATLERPALFSALPLEKVLDLFANVKMEEAQRVKQNKDMLLSDWQSIALAETDNSPGKFTVIQGRSYVYSKIQQLIGETKSHLSFVATVPSLARAEVFGLFDAVFNHPLRSKIQFRFLTELSKLNVQTVKMLLQKKPKAGFLIEVKTPELGMKLCPRMIIRDNVETIFFLDSKKDPLSSEQDDTCLWTNSSSLVNAFSTMFEDMWHNSTDIQKKIVQMEIGKPLPQNSFIQETETTHEKHVDTILSAEKEIIMMTSAENLFRFWKNKTYTKEWMKRDVSVRIMAPITSENFEAAKELSQFIEVRHVPRSYLETTIVDRRHLFYFKEVYPDGKKPSNAPHYRDTYYTNDLEQVRRIADTMDNIWKNALPTYSFTLESITGYYGFMPPSLSSNHWKAMQGVTVIEEKLGTITESEVLNKIINDKQTLDGKERMYAAAALALIHPPDSFNLPDLLFRINHIDKRSGLGGEDTMAVYLWLETPEGHAYVPAGNIGDNPVAVNLRRETGFRDSPAKQNCQLVMKDEIQVRAYGNSLFCGWAVPIQLYPKYVLPPACLLIEGYGKVKTKAFSIILTSGVKFEVEQNYFDAFVTFMHPTSKYSGPGTDGIFVRDLIVTTIPSKK
jgi:sugar-specific transcriptional regulator TrmB